jgi:hypothetical protein
VRKRWLICRKYGHVTCTCRVCVCVRACVQTLTGDLTGSNTKSYCTTQTYRKLSFIEDLCNLIYLLLWRQMITLWQCKLMFLVLKMKYNLTWCTTNVTAHCTHNLGSVNGKSVLISVDKLWNYQHGSDFAVISWLYLLVLYHFIT